MTKVGEDRVFTFNEEDRAVYDRLPFFYIEKHTNYVRRLNDGSYLHNLIMQPGPNQVVDHIDGNPLNNTRENLRLCTVSQNNQNRGKFKTYKGAPTTSGYKGVTYEQGRWRARIQANGKRVHLGLFDTERDAACAYNGAAVVLHGEFARLNVIGG